MSNKPSKILYVSPNAKLGGAEKGLEIFLKKHDRSQFVPSVAFLRDGPLVAKWRAMGVETHVLPLVRMREVWRHSAVIDEIARIITQNKIDMVHSVMSYGHYFGGRAAARAGVKNVWFQHGPVGKFDKFASLVKTDCIITNSRYTEKTHRETALMQWPMKVVDAGTDLEILPPEREASARVYYRQVYGFSEDHIVFGTVGRIEEWKGQMEFLRAFRWAQQECPALRALIIGCADLGSRQYEEALKQFVIENNLEGKVVMPGFVDDLASSLQAMDVFVHSAIIPEPYGLNVIEAMGQGLPVIASRFGGPGEYVNDGVTGFHVDPNDCIEFTGLLTCVARAPLLRSQVARAGREFVLKERTADRFTRQIEEIYVKLLNKSSKPVDRVPEVFV